MKTDGEMISAGKVRRWECLDCISFKKVKRI